MARNKIVLKFSTNTIPHEEKYRLTGRLFSSILCTIFIINLLFHITNLNLNFQQSILQLVEKDTSVFLPVVNDQLNNIFGPTSSFFINTTPRKFLFEGIEFCKNPIGIPQIVCTQVEERKSPTIIKSADGSSLKFSMFSHVILSMIFLLLSRYYIT
jgi:hypothetical protein